MVSDGTLNILAKAVDVVDASRALFAEIESMSDQEFVEHRPGIMDVLNRLNDQFWMANVAMAMQGGLTTDEIRLLVVEIRKGGQHE